MPDFVAQVWKPLMKKCIENGVKIVTNAGGLNPEACKQAVEKIAEEAGLKVGFVVVVVVVVVGCLCAITY